MCKKLCKFNDRFEGMKSQGSDAVKIQNVAAVAPKYYGYRKLKVQYLVQQSPSCGLQVVALPFWVFNASFLGLDCIQVLGFIALAVTTLVDKLAFVMFMFIFMNVGNALQGIKDIAHEDGALLCFDEVMTGFRIAKGCAQEYFGVTPDLTTLGKVIGGGLPVGAYGGRADIMNMVAPAGPMYQVFNSTPYL